MTDRVCVRGCFYPGQHLPNCPDASPYSRLLYAIVTKAVPAKCGGCLPREAWEGALLCEGCIRRTRRVLEQAPDLCEHIRSMIDPLKSGWNFDRELVSGGGGEMPAPVKAALLDAGDYVIAKLTWYAEYFGDVNYGRFKDGWPSDVSPERAYQVTYWAAEYLIEKLPEIANDSAVLGFTEKVIGVPGGDEWSVAKALGRFPIQDRATWSRTPCPECKKKTVKITPPRYQGGMVRYRCSGCEWSPSILQQKRWDHYFEGVGR